MWYHLALPVLVFITGLLLSVALEEQLCTAAAN